MEIIQNLNYMALYIIDNVKRAYHGNYMSSSKLIEASKALEKYTKELDEIKQSKK